MKHEFLVTPPHLNQAFEPGGSSGGGWGNGITRRSFIKRTGGATVAALVAWNLNSAKANTENDANDSSSGSEWGMICTSPTFENSEVEILTEAITVIQYVTPPEEERFRIKVTINSNKFMDPPDTGAYDECLIQYTASVAVYLPVGTHYAHQFTNMLVTADKNGGSPRWQRTYESQPETIDAKVGDYPVAHVKITVRPNNGLDSFGLIISSEWTDFTTEPGIGFELRSIPFETLYVPYPHVFVPKLK